MKFLAIITLAALVLFTFTVINEKNAKNSIYTSTGDNDCQTIQSSSIDGHSYIGACEAPLGYEVHLLDGDDRQTINIITRQKKKFELNFWKLFSGFSAIKGDLEWRTQDNLPIAMIARLEVVKNKSKAIYLIVSKISETLSCVTDVVPPSQAQGEIARKLADASFSKACKQFNGHQESPKL